MPVTLGAKPQGGFDDPIGLLSDCHRRIEHFLEILEKIAQHYTARPLDGGAALALEKALVYFRSSAPKHTADEESSLFPRLRSKDSPEVAEALELLLDLEEDHKKAEALHKEADRLGQRLLAESKLPPAASERLQSVLSELRELYGRHIGLEDNKLFPLAARHLDSTERAAIGREMASRRGVR